MDSETETDTGTDAPQDMPRPSKHSGGETLSQRMQSAADARDRASAQSGRPDEDNDLSEDLDDGEPEAPQRKGRPGPGRTKASQEEGDSDEEESSETSLEEGDGTDEEDKRPEDTEDPEDVKPEKRPDSYARMTSQLAASQRELVNLKKSEAALKAEVKRLADTSRAQTKDPSLSRDIDDYDAALQTVAKRLGVKPDDPRAAEALYELATEAILRKHPESESAEIKSWKEAKARAKAENAQIRELRERQDAFERQQLEAQAELAAQGDMQHVVTLLGPMAQSGDLAHAIRGCDVEGINLVEFLYGNIRSAIAQGQVPAPSTQAEADELIRRAALNTNAHYARIAGATVPASTSPGQVKKSPPALPKPNKLPLQQKREPLMKRRAGGRGTDEREEPAPRQFRSLTEKINHQREVEARRGRG